MKCLSLLVMVGLVGCSSQSELMPLKVGDSWRYSVSTGFSEYVAEVKVVREAAVGGLDGFVLSGPMGESSLAWQEDVLIGERFANTRFAPAIPLLIDSRVRLRKTWKGTVQGAWGKFEGTATLNQAPSEEQIAGRRVKVTKVELVVINPKGKSLRLTTLFQAGVGIASQYQWVGGDLIVRIERLSGS